MKLFKLLLKLAAIVLLFIALFIAWFVMTLNNFQNSPLKITEPTVFIVEPGASLHRVANQLQSQGLVEQARYLTLLGRWQGQAGRIHAGEYQLEPGIKPLQLLDKMVAGEVLQYSFTIVEGWTFREMLKSLQAHPKIKLELQGMTDEQIMSRLGSDYKHPEGLFLPETYHFPTGLTDLAFLKRAYRAMAKQLDEEWDKRDKDLPYKSAYEALIMASIIEKETALPSERPEIAGVFVRRLQKKMRLQTDPTVIYGIPNFDGDIRRRDLRTDTPYNTYTRHGLTPTPIALPSIEAINAALHPKEGDTLYFVASGGGGHYFSKTLAEHSNAVRKYLLNRKK